MTVTLRGTAGTSVAAAAAAPQTATPTMPTSTATGDRVFVMAVTEPSGTAPTLSANGTGWTQLYSSAPQSTSQVTCWYRDKDASWSTMPTVSNAAGSSSTNALIVGSMALVRSGSTWNTPTFTTGVHGTSGPSLNVTGAANLSVTTGNYLFAFVGTSGNSTTTNGTLTATGATLGTAVEVADLGSSNGGGASIKIIGAPVSSGTETAAPNVSMTLSGSNTASVYFVRQTDSSVSVPVVDAGVDVASQTVNTAFSRTMSATNSPTSYAWTISSGPTGVGTTIGTAAALSWTPTAAGSYVLQAAATNAGGTGTDTMSITVVSAGGASTVAYDAVGPSSAGLYGSATTSITWSHTCSGTNRYVIVGVSNTTGAATTTATFGGTAMVNLGSRVSGGGGGGSNAYVTLFGLVNPPTGASTVVVTSSASTELLGGSISFTGVNQSAPVGTAVTNASAGDQASVSVTVTGTTSGNMVVDVADFGASAGITGTTQTQRFLKNQNGNSAGGNVVGATAAAGGSITMGHSSSSVDFWGIVAVEILADPGSGSVLPGSFFPFLQG